MTIAFIGNGAIAKFAMARLAERGRKPRAIIVRRGREKPAIGDRPPHIADVADLPGDVDMLVECAGPDGLRAHAPPALRRGIDVIVVSIAALADAECEAGLAAAAKQGGGRLRFVSGAIGGLDALRVARIGGLNSVTYTGRKPLRAWKGSPAEEVLDLDRLSRPAVHFSGTARAAATAYPKNANVAAAVALSGLGFDDTKVELIADPQADKNTHEIDAAGGFGRLRFFVAGMSLPDNPRTSALAAMSVADAVMSHRQSVGF